MTYNQRGDKMKRLVGDRYARVTVIDKMRPQIERDEKTAIANISRPGWTPRRWYQYARCVMSQWWDADTIEERLAVQGAWVEIPVQYRRAAKATPRNSAMPKPKRIIS